MWRGQTNLEDRILASLPYLLPLVVSLAFGAFIFRQFPALTIIFIVLSPIAPLAIGIPGFIIFFLLLGLVVRNRNIKHFIRFNTMQALLIDIGLSIILLAIELLGFLFTPILGLLGSAAIPILSTISSTIFLGVFFVTIYSWYVIFQGRYPEVPIISEAAYYYTRY